ncbi:MAG: TlpA disulfide reductase family protein [Halieaceae bacterium]|nr:TlpA disulfide reductase family protein [Halieaceae bacterium]
MVAVLALVLLSACGERMGTPEGVLSAPALAGNWTVINYWAEWCAPCRDEIPELNRLAFSSSELDVYAVNFDEVQGDVLLSQAADLDIQFPLLSTDPGPRLGLVRPTVLPTTLILNPAGEEVTRLIGPQTEAAIRHELALARESTNPSQ